MARRRKKSRPYGRWALALAGAVALFAVGLWLARDASGPFAIARPNLPGDRATAPAKPVATARPRNPTAPRPTDLAPVATPTPRPTAGRIALIFDDLGRDVAQVDLLAALGAPLTYSVLPYERWSREVAIELEHRGAEVLCHLPMQATGDEDPGPGALLEGMSRRRLTAAVERALEEVPGAVGVNNHMGSALTADRKAMGDVLPVLDEHGLFFVDSRTSAESVGYELALELGVPTARRDVFLDDVDEEEAIRTQWQRLLALSRERGAAIAIGHPRKRTLAILAEEIPRAVADGFEFVPVSYLLERGETLPE